MGRVPGVWHGLGPLTQLSTYPRGQTSPQASHLQGSGDAAKTKPQRDYFYGIASECLPRRKGRVLIVGNGESMGKNSGCVENMWPDEEPQVNLKSGSKDLAVWDQPGG